MNNDFFYQARSTTSVVLEAWFLLVNLSERCIIIANNTSFNSCHEWKSFKLGSLDTAAYETCVPSFDVHNTAFIGLHDLSDYSRSKLFQVAKWVF
jgi:hypothetical protein